jgi:hypothetical protein
MLYIKAEVEFSFEKKTPGVYWIGGYVGGRACPDIWKPHKISWFSLQLNHDS